jgi:hypothetical protein
MAGQAETAGAVMRAYVAELRAGGELEALLPRLSPEAAKLVEKPPLPVTWVDIRLVHEPLVALHGLKGRAAVRAVAHRAAAGQLGSMFRPLLASTLRLFGASPTTLFTRMDTITGIMLRGLKFTWTPSGPSSGTMAIEYPFPVHDALFAAWEGMLNFAFDLVQTKGTVAQARAGDGGKRAEIDVRW